MTASDNTLTQVLQPLDVVDASGADRVGYYQKVYCVFTLVTITASLIVTTFPMSVNRFIGIAGLVLACGAWLGMARNKKTKNVKDIVDDNHNHPDQG